MELIGRAELRLAAAPSLVWATLADVGAWRRWMPGVRWSVLEGALGSAGAYVTIKPERGRQTAFHAVADSPRAIALGMTFGPVASLRRSWILQPDGIGTRVIATVEIGGPLRRWLVAAAARRAQAESPALLEALRAAIAVDEV